MAKNVIGTVAIVYKGTYDEEVTYHRLNMVMYNGGAYISKADNNTGHEVTDTDYWITATNGINSITEEIEGREHNYTINFSNGGTYEFTITDGYTPVKGVDYYTIEDIESLEIPRKTSDIQNDSHFGVTNANNNFSTSQTINGTLTVNGDIVQNGTSYETHAEKLYTSKDLIITRDKAVGGLATGEYTGIKAKKYNGTDDGLLVFDANGLARVGDEDNTQPLATRKENSEMTNGQYVMWNSTTMQLETHDITEKIQTIAKRITHTLPEPVEGLITLEGKQNYYIGETSSLNIAFPSTNETGNWVSIVFESGSTPTTVTINNLNLKGNYDITPVANKTYEIYAEFDGSNWVVQYIGY